MRAPLIIWGSYIKTFLLRNGIFPALASKQRTSRSPAITALPLELVSPEDTQDVNTQETVPRELRGTPKVIIRDNLFVHLLSLKCVLENIIK